jgi:hypothetical protein
MRTTTWRRGRTTPFFGSGLSTLIMAAYLVIGVFVASDHRYFNHVNDVTDVISAILGVVLWPLILADVNLHVH